MAQIGAKLRLAQALLGEALTESFHADPVLGGHALFGLFENAVFNADTQVLRQAQLGTLIDQALQHLTHQHFAARHKAALLLLQLLNGLLDLLLQLLVGDGLRVNHRHDEVRRSGTRGVGSDWVEHWGQRLTADANALGQAHRAGAQEHKACKTGKPRLPQRICLFTHIDRIGLESPRSRASFDSVARNP